MPVIKAVGGHGHCLLCCLMERAGSGLSTSQPRGVSGEAAGTRCAGRTPGGGAGGGDDSVALSQCQGFDVMSQDVHSYPETFLSFNFGSTSVFHINESFWRPHCLRVSRGSRDRKVGELLFSNFEGGPGPVQPFGCTAGHPIDSGNRAC